ncbi:MAG: hypothetical protein JXQ81_03280, partial [Desulfuromonadales bacterium]|nr:hypothetical protein [Desulfuromonadales bacterium]MBN2791510.1 hypothetical protein [Desulfuromonadales bacterium]
LFSNHVKSARQEYRHFVADGIKHGKRPELIGGGLQRSQTGQTNQEEPQLYDERVLGSGHFVQQLQDNGLLGCSIQSKMTLDELMVEIIDKYSISTDHFMRRARCGKVSEARSIFCYCAVRRLGHSGAATARYLGIGPSSVSRSARKGEQIIQTEAGLLDWIKHLKH